MKYPNKGKILGLVKVPSSCTGPVTDLLLCTGGPSVAEPTLLSGFSLLSTQGGHTLAGPWLLLFSVWSGNQSGRSFCGVPGPGPAEPALILHGSHRFHWVEDWLLWPGKYCRALQGIKLSYLNWSEGGGLGGPAWGGGHCVGGQGQRGEG